jgi:hypothetical protein
MSIENPASEMIIVYEDGTKWSVLPRALLGAVLVWSIIVAMILAVVMYDIHAAHADEAKPACQFSWQQLTEVSDELVAHHANVKETKLEGDQAKHLLVFINASGPGADIDFDGAVFLENTETHLVKFAFSKDGCVFKVAQITSDQFHKLMNDVAAANP